MQQKKSRYQQGSISKVQRATGWRWKVRFSEYKDGKRWQRTLLFDPAKYPTEKKVREALELTVSQVNSGTAGEKADAKFGTITALYRADHIPTLDHSTRANVDYLLRDYIEDKFSKTPLREMRPLAINNWLQGLKLSATTKAAIRSIMSVCFRLAALHEFLPPMEANPMSLIKIKGVTKRKKRRPEVSIENFKKLLAALPEPLNIMVLVDSAYGLRVSELLALKWEDIDVEAKTLSIVRKFTRGQIGETKTAASEAPLPLATPILDALIKWRPKTSESEWVFPSPSTGGPRSASMLLQKGIKPVAAGLGLGDVGFHSLRHACRSWLTSMGVDLGTTKGLMRHANISTTMDVYGSALTDDMRQAHEKLVKELTK
jgi:integrase